MARLREKALLFAADRKSAAIAGATLIGFLLLGALLLLVIGTGLTQLVVTLLLPAAVMIAFWVNARSQLVARQVALDAALELAAVDHRAGTGLLAAVSHELRPHPQLCSLRSEARAVAEDYGSVDSDLKVAVPDVVLLTDPHLLRHVLHILVGNALRHGGGRVAIWASAENGWVGLTVSDDGPGLAPDVGARVFERYVDLAGDGMPAHPIGAGLALARTLGDLLGGHMTYKRDATWTHFSLRLPTGIEAGRPTRARVPLEAGVR